jgi:membrane protease YdiL (CAAX protease family)
VERETRDPETPLQLLNRVEADQPRSSISVFIAAGVSYAAVLSAFWFTAQQFAIGERIGGHLPSAFASLALLLLPYWAFGFGAAGWLQHALKSTPVRVLLPGLLVLPYEVFAAPRGEFRASIALVLAAIPIALAALFEFAPPGGLRGSQAGITWQDVVVLAAIGVPVEFGLLRGAWPYPGLGAMPKLLLMDAGLYAFLVVRGLDGVGYDFRPRLRGLLVGLREWTFYAPIAIVLGLALGFIKFHAHVPVPALVAAGWLITFFFVALPEELFFRGLLMNLLERRIGMRRALILSSVIFGLSHFNKPLPFNWRYVLMATIAGVFYARAWHDRRRLLSSGITHATVDVVWSVWFR